jgi:hypothetical protein
VQWRVGLEELLGRVAGRFGRVEPRRRAGAVGAVGLAQAYRTPIEPRLVDVGRCPIQSRLTMATGGCPPVIRPTAPAARSSARIRPCWSAGIRNACHSTTRSRQAVVVRRQPRTSAAANERALAGSSDSTRARWSASTLNWFALGVVEAQVYPRFRRPVTGQSTLTILPSAGHWLGEVGHEAGRRQ